MKWIEFLSESDCQKRLDTIVDFLFVSVLSPSIYTLYKPEWITERRKVTENCFHPKTLCLSTTIPLSTNSMNVTSSASRKSYSSLYITFLAPCTWKSLRKSRKFGKVTLTKQETKVKNCHCIVRLKIAVFVLLIAGKLYHLKKKSRTSCKFTSKSLLKLHTLKKPPVSMYIVGMK